MIAAVNTELMPYLKASQGQYVSDSIGTTLNMIFRRLSVQFSGTAMLTFSKTTATKMVAGVSMNNKRRFEESVKSATGVDLGGIIQAEGLEDFMELSISKNASLIKSLPEEYLKQVETIVNNGVISGARYSDIAKEVQSKTGANKKLVNRIKTIATNEVQTINAQINLRRNEALGIKRGIYMTSDDERVRKCHAELDGVEYDLAKGAWSKSCGRYIKPGVTDINCRCSFRPIIEVD